MVMVLVNNSVSLISTNEEGKWQRQQKNENIDVFVDQNVKLLQAGRICWSEAPTVVVIQKPYTIALFPRHSLPSISISFGTDYCPPYARHLIKSNNAIVVASNNSVYGFFPVPIGAQIVQLTASGDFEEALALCKLLPPEDASLRAAKEGSIHIRYTHYLFDNGYYEEEMEHFLASQVDITYVLSLYPSIVLPKTTTVHGPEKLVDVSLDASQLSRDSSCLSDDLETSLIRPSESDENAALEFKKMSHNTLMALIKCLQKKRSGIVEKAAAEGTEEGRGNISINSAAREMAAILDTALLQALLLTGRSAAALELLKCLNYCDVNTCEELLQKGNHYTALLELYKNIGILGQSISCGTWKPLCGTDPMLVLEFSMPILESCPTQTIVLFLSGNIPADMVNSYLKQHLPNMNENGISENLQNEMLILIAMTFVESISGYNPEALLRRLSPDALFEERAILLGKLNQHELALSLYVHKLRVPEMALAYCDCVYESAVHQLPGKSSGNIYLTLLQIYLYPQKTTKNFERRIANLALSPNTSVQKVGSGASMRSKGGRRKIASRKGAEDMRISSSHTDSGRSDGDIEESSEEGDSTVMFDQVLDLLSRRWDRINEAQALKLLSRETKLQSFMNMVGPQICFVRFLLGI
ncbi:protein-lysine methyltransferase METTL21C-like [Hibiscus syriacus]|uniref:Protein-lysine methyltransferase METTL21C-like n=1 Tax=Hibiscus syriacus TaxID=106335 RepID=A0A6A3AXK5_HIBSY|nr:protein-lysine methyltransferase METTL21C-like [Hibiscus syriacus]